MDKHVVTKRWRCMVVWYRFCLILDKLLQNFFEKLGFLVFNHSKEFAIVGIITSLALTAGFFRMRTINRVEELYIPQTSQSLVDLDRASENFILKVTAEEFIIKNKLGNWALTNDVFEAALDVHEGVMSIEGLESVCIKNHAGKCFSQNPLEIFQFNKSLLHNINDTLNAVYNDKTMVLSDGAVAGSTFSNFFAYFNYNQNIRKITRAEAVRVVYFVRYPENSNQHSENSAWEAKYAEYLTRMQRNLSARGLTLLYTSGRSLDDSVSEASLGDLKLIASSLFFMVTFCTFTLSKFRNSVKGHFWIGNFGLVTLMLGIGAAFGLAMLVGFPYVAFAGALPFLIIGVGIDNMFIILDCLDRQDPNLRGSERVSKTMGYVGASITMTTLTDLIAFGVSMVTDFPVIKYFCLYAALSITICFILVITLFLAILTYEVRRIESGRQDFIFCSVNKSYLKSDSWSDSNQSISSKLMEVIATYLMKPTVKWLVFISSIILLAAGVYGSINIDQNFDILDLGLKGSQFLEFYSYRNKAYPNGYEVSILLDTPVDYSDSEIQQSYTNISSISLNNKFLLNKTSNWLLSYLKWANELNFTVSGAMFYSNLQTFLYQHKEFYRDIKFYANGTIRASRIWVFTGDNPSSIFRKDMMIYIRKELKKVTNLPVYPIHIMFIYIEQFVIILRDTIRNLLICSLSIVVITLPYLKQPLVTFLVFWGFMCLIFELMGLMYIWNVSLNSLSMIIIVMAIGFSVDYSAHIAHAFTISKLDTPEKQVIDALKTMGTSVFMGGTSTFVGVIATGFASSEIFKIFFKMVFGIVTLGLLHGLIFLPVLLSIFCRNNNEPRVKTDDLQVEVRCLQEMHEKQNDETHPLTSPELVRLK